MTKQSYSSVYSQQNWKNVVKYLFMNVHNSIIYNSQKVETTQMPINGWMYKQKYNGILLNY
jgi:hypothetical protein